MVFLSKRHTTEVFAKVPALFFKDHSPMEISEIKYDKYAFSIVRAKYTYEWNENRHIHNILLPELTSDGRQQKHHTPALNKIYFSQQQGVNVKILIKSAGEECYTFPQKFNIKQKKKRVRNKKLLF